MPESDDYESYWSLNVNSAHERHQELDQLSREKSITNEIHFQPALQSETLELSTVYKILCAGNDLELADMCPEKYNARSTDVNNSYLISNTGALRAPNVET